MSKPVYYIVAGRKKTVVNLLEAVTVPQTSVLIAVGSGSRTIQAAMTGTGAIAATINVYGSNLSQTTGGELIAVMTLSGTDADNTGAVISAEWPFMYAELVDITGTDGSVTLTVGA